MTAPIRTLIALGLLTGTLLAVPLPAPDPESPPPVGRISLPQSFLEEDGGFLMLGDHLAASFEAGRMRWILTGPTPEGLRRHVVTLEPVGSAGAVAPVAEDPLPGVVSRFHGPPSAWRSGQRTFATLRYPDLWPGIDLVLEASGQTLKGTYVVAPGADPGQVRLRHVGADAVTVDPAGQLVIRTPVGELVDAAPVAWQDVDGARRDIPVAFSLDDAGGAVDVGFDLGPHDPTAPLLIDPAVIVQAGFLGGVQDDFPGGIEVGPDGSVYVAGGTQSSEASFPAIVGPDLTFAGPVSSTGGDAYVAKLDPTGTTLIYAGFIGGTEREAVWDTALDSLGRLYLCGLSESSPGDGFPVTVGPDITFNGNCDAIAVRVSADGTALEYAGYLGGNGEDFASGIDVDDSFRAWVVGRFDSLASTLPIHGGPILTQPGGPIDGFVARIRADGDWHDFCGYLGGDDYDYIEEVVVDGAGGAWFSGSTWSQDFPTVGTLGPTGNGSIDFIIGRVAPDGLSLTACGYVGSTGSEFVANMAVDGDGAAYVSGTTYGATSFPAVVGPELTPSSTTEGALVKVAPDGQSVVWAGFTGTGQYGEVQIGSDGAPWVLTRQADGGHLTTDPVLARIDPAGTSFTDQFVLPMPGDTFLRYFAPVPAALTPGSTDWWIAGWTTETETTFPVVSGPDVTANGLNDTVILRVSVPGAAGPWTDLGFALGGTHGDPLLGATGSLTAGSPLSVTLDGALENATAWIVYGPDTLYAPFYGGTLVPDVVPPNNFLPLTASATGELDLATTWPAGVPSGYAFHMQYWIEDPAGPFGFAASNALRGTAP